MTLSFSLRFDFFRLLMLVLAAATLGALAHYFSARQHAQAAPDFDLEDAQELAEQIYADGAVRDRLEGLPLGRETLDKLAEEIDRQLAKTTDKPGCEVYHLVVVQDGYYPILGYGDAVIGYDMLRAGEVWRVGMTCNGEEGRYPGEYFYKSKDGAVLVGRETTDYQKVFQGTFKQAITVEKILIYTYPFWSGHPNYEKPFGNKIFR